MNSPIKIIVLISNLQRGGTETHLLNIFTRLDKSRFNPEIFVLADRGDLAAKMEELGVRVSTPWVRADGKQKSFLKRVFRLSAISVQLWFYLLMHRPKIIHFFLPQSYWIGGPISILAGVPCRVMSRRSLRNYQMNYRFIDKFERLLHKSLDAALGNSSAVVNELVAENIPPERVQLIYNGIDHSQYHSFAKRESQRRMLGIAYDTVVMVVVANLIEYKGHEDLIRGLARITGQIRAPWKLFCIGRDDGIGLSLENLAVELGIGAHVTFTGSCEDVRIFLSAADIGILPSHEEGFSNAVIECMAAGLPMVVTAAGGNIEAVCHGETGYVVPIRNPEALAASILQLANDRSLAKQMGRMGRERVERLYSIKTCVEAYENFYTSLIA